MNVNLSNLFNRLLRTRKMFTKIEKLSTGAAVMFVPAKPQANTAPGVLIVHGKGSKPFSSSTYKLLREGLYAAGFCTVTVSLRGHEEAEGDPLTVTALDHRADILAAMDYLREQPGVDVDHISAVGVSWGGYLLASLAFELGIKTLVLSRPALYPIWPWEQPMQTFGDILDLKEWRSEVHTPLQSTSLAQLLKFKGNVCIFAAGEDEQMPPAVIESYADAVHAGSDKLEIFTLAGAKHTLVGEEQQILADKVTFWLEPVVQSLELI